MDDVKTGQKRSRSWLPGASYYVVHGPDVCLHRASRAMPFREVPANRCGTHPGLKIPHGKTVICFHDRAGSVLSRELTDIPHKFYSAWLDPDHEARRVATRAQVRGKRIKCYCGDLLVAELALCSDDLTWTEAEIIGSMRACEIPGVDLRSVKVQPRGAACVVQ